jgi:apolipoprotein N-acyltransferase
MRRASVLALLGGLCLAAATPPWGFWPLAFVGIAVLHHVLEGATGAVRFGRAWILWAALLFPTLLWMQDMTLPGYVVACIAYAGFLATGTMLAPRGPGVFIALPGGVILAEWVRWRWPFGGVPLSNLATGQVEGVLAPMLRLGGALFVVGMTVVVGGAVAAALKRCWRVAAGLGLVAAATLALAVVAPDGEPTGEVVDVALVQGGGPQGTRAEDTAPGIVFERHLAASEELEGDFDLVLWPEDVIDVETFADGPEQAQLRALARRHDATFVVGVIEDEGEDAFHNWAVVVGPDGDEVDRYEKVERVPFGEWVPLRELLEPLAGGALPSRDALVGREPPVVDTPVGRLGVAISWEIFFGERVRAAVDHDAEAILNPTNGASFRGTQVQSQQIANSQMRAIENGRWVAQAAPTGFTAVITPDGEVRQRTAVSETAIVYDTVEMRTGRTVYTRVGDHLALGFAALSLAVGWLADRRGWFAGRRQGRPGVRKPSHSPVVSSETV